VSDIDIAVADSLKVLDLKRPIREADMLTASAYFGSATSGLTPAAVAALFDDLISAGEQRGRHGNAKGPRCAQVYG
jgi:hypothetical protein